MGAGLPVLELVAVECVCGAGCGSEQVSFTRDRSGRQKLQRSHSALLVGEAGLEVRVRGKIDRREGDVSQEARFGALHGHGCESSTKPLKGRMEGRKKPFRGHVTL